jgi:hypothetical protein
VAARVDEANGTQRASHHLQTGGRCRGVKSGGSAAARDGLGLDARGADGRALWRSAGRFLSRNTHASRQEYFHSVYMRAYKWCCGATSDAATRTTRAVRHTDVVVPLSRPEVPRVGRILLSTTSESCVSRCV